MPALSSTARPRSKSRKSSAESRPTKRNQAATSTANESADAKAEVFTLAEAAHYLRVSTDDVLALAEANQLPGRRIGAEWRFFKTALQVWLSRMPSHDAPNDFWALNAGIFRDDPDMTSILNDIYAARGRSM